MQNAISALGPFIGGFNTEITQVTEASNYTTDELNCQLLKDGTRARRYGIGVEDNGVALTTTFKEAEDWDTWMLNSEDQVIKKTTTGDYSFEITEEGAYFIVLVGGGGGGSNGFGGAGAGVVLRTTLTPGTYTGTVGAGGRGASAYVRNNDGVSGGDTSLTGSGLSVTAHGGIRRKGRRNGGSGGGTGNLDYFFTQSYKIIDRTTDGEYTNKSFITDDTTGAGAGGVNQPSDTGAGYAGTDGMVCVIPQQYSDTDYYETPLETVCGYYWNNYDKKGSDCIVVQQGKFLSMYKASKPYSSTVLATIDIENYITDSDNFLKDKLRFNSGNGYLVVVSEYTKPFYVWFSGEAILSSEEIKLKVRDLKGLNETLAIDEQPTTLGDAHKYNLYNQGWDQDKIDAYHSSASKYPANSQIWSVAIDGNYDFKPAALKKYYFGNTPAPKGHYILEYTNKDRSAASGIEGILPDTSNHYPVDVNFHSGRFFYLSDSTVLYSQVILENIGNIEKCYQDADPTSQDISDLIDTDGGTINFQEIGKGVAIEKFPIGLLVFGKKAVYSITSASGTSFTATDYSGNLVINIGAYSKAAIVNADGTVYFWAPQGIYAINVDEVSGTSAVATCITDTTIKTWYDALPEFSKANCRGIYDYTNRKVIWHFPTNEEELSRLDGSITFYLNSNSFVPGKISDGGKILDCVYLNYPSKVNPAVSLWAGNDEIYEEGIEITVSEGTEDYEENTSVIYLGYVYDTGKMYFCEYNERDFLDWDRTGFKSYAVSFPINLGSTYLKKYVPVIQPYYIRTEEAKLLNNTYISPSSCYLRVRWNWGRNYNSSRWDLTQQSYWPNVNNFIDFKYINSKIRVRGRGEAFQIAVESEGENDFRLAGINILTRTE